MAMKLMRLNALVLYLAITVTTPFVLVVVHTIASLPSAIALTIKLPYQFKKPPGNGAPGTASDGSSRGDCKVENAVLRAIAPIGKDKNKTVGGLTNSAQPKFWFSTNMNSDCGKLEFVLQTHKGFTLYRAPIEMPKDSKPFAVQLPSTIDLKPGKSYQWSLLSKRPNNPPMEVNGWVQRVEMEEPTGTPIVKAITYADQGIWHEAASIVRSILEQDPTDPRAIAFWNTIVSDAGLKDRADPNPF
jgi:Domain of Unknown Function (DUF928)